MNFICSVSLFLQSSTQRLWFGRDVFGRRSLLWHTGDGLDEPFSLTSVACADTALEGKGDQPFWSEVPAVGVFCASMKEMCEGKPSLHCYPWKQCGQCLIDGRPYTTTHTLLTTIYPSHRFFVSGQPVRLVIRECHGRMCSRSCAQRLSDGPFPSSE